jgi:hypothetical protein
MTRRVLRQTFPLNSSIWWTQAINIIINQYQSIPPWKLSFPYGDVPIRYSHCWRRVSKRAMKVSAKGDNKKA